MTLSILQNNSPVVTMSSLELLEVVNQARAMHNEGEIRRNDFTARCQEELFGEHYETFVVRNPNGTASNALRMTRDQCMYVLMRESKAVRRTATEFMNKQAASVLDSEEGKLLLIQELATKQLALIHENKQIAIERDHAIKTKAQIGSKREATAMATASAAKKESASLKAQLGFNAQHATVKAVQAATGRPYAWLPLRRWCEALNQPPKNVTDPLYGAVKAWPGGAWMACYSVDLVDLFGEVVA